MARSPCSAASGQGGAARLSCECRTASTQPSKTTTAQLRATLHLYSLQKLTRGQSAYLGAAQNCVILVA